MGTDSSLFDTLVGIAISSDGVAFMFNLGSNTVTSCTVSGSTLISCANWGADSTFFRSSQGIAISNGIAFVANAGASTVTSFPVPGSAAGDPHLLGANGIKVRLCWRT